MENKLDLSPNFCIRNTSAVARSTSGGFEACKFVDGKDLFRDRETNCRARTAR